ncbi:hypothetical protein [Phaeobacter inhibens]|uniref:Uncharacterized protein n=1 Tax=Phaeobacter inhibens TaxID=221822 RepID=A0A2I7KDV6_9RHOB|nr:hypothetical protein [Phaeobacter inhibens]AUR00792.1 hypothetical protein PhaeoP88_03471 [Phaeobacter inhibens]
MTPETLALITAYFICSATAEDRILARPEVETCTALYMETKLSFLPDVDSAAYAAMSAEQRAKVNQRGYAAYVAWRASNPALVAELEAKARSAIAGLPS